MLPDDLVRATRRARESCACAADFLTLALAALAWNAYHHTMRQLVPAEAWADEALFDAGVRRMEEALRHGEEEGEAAAFDVQMHAVAGPTVYHARAHAADARRAWHFAWGEVTSQHHGEAAVRAALHPNRVCAVLSLATGGLVSVRVDGDAVAALERISGAA